MSMLMDVALASELRIGQVNTTAETALMRRRFHRDVHLACLSSSLWLTAVDQEIVYE
jgi:hypothetical protein